MSKAGNLWRKVHGRIARRPTNFSWLINDKLAGSGMVTSGEEMQWLLKKGIKSVVTMTEDPLPKEWTGQLRYMHLPTEDLSAPDISELERAVDFIHEQISSGNPAMVHCAAGIGRTGTLLACYLIKHHSLSHTEAIEQVRQKRPGSIQSDSQEFAISLFYEYVVGNRKDNVNSGTGDTKQQ